jgi:iron complex outermembrane receptor protein
VGLDYSLTKRTTLGVVLNGFYNPRHWESKTFTDIYEPNGQLRDKTNAFTWNDEKWKNYSANLNFRTILDSAGQELTGDLDYIQYKATNYQPLYSFYYDKNGVPTQTPDTLIGVLPQDIKIYSGKIDYLLPLKKGARFEAGIKSSFVETDNNAIYNNIVNGQPVLDSGRNNHFIYEENINAAYVNYSRPLGKKWNAQLGLRVENTSAKGNSAGYEFDTDKNKFVHTNKIFDRNYTQLFPTAYLQYKASDIHSFVLNYGRRINRPDYQDLNPFINFLDRYTFEQGNPNLKPQFSHNVELSHTYKGFLTTTANFSQTTDIIQQVLEQNELTNETFIKKANIASRRQFGLSVSANKEITKWWSGNVYVNLYNNHFEGIVNNENISIGINGAMMQLQQQFKLGKGWSAELSGFYRTKAVEGVIFIRPMGMVNAGLSKQVLKNKGTVRLNVRDIFAGSVFKGYSKYGNVDAEFKNVNDSRAVSLNFTWRFSKGKMNGAGQRKKGSADDETNRVKVGN